MCDGLHFTELSLFLLLPENLKRIMTSHLGPNVKKMAKNNFIFGLPAVQLTDPWNIPWNIITR